jgi:ribose/xylose/arabinose/galactoside ABC-type transport system permease subunit
MSAAVDVSPGTGPGAAARGRPALLASLAPVAGIVVVLLLAAVVSPGFYSGANLELVLYQAGFIGVMAIGQTFVLLTGGIDLSMGAVLAVTAVIVAQYTAGADGPLPGAVALAAGAGLLIGAVNAALVVVRRVPPFVATFAVFVLVQGAITAYTKGAPSGNVPAALGDLGAGRLLGAPLPVWIFAGLLALGAVALARTTWGRRLYVAGSNRRAGELAGVRGGWVIAGAYVIAALLAVLAGLINAGYVGQVDAQLASSLNLDPIAAAVIGGVALVGGRGHLGQTLTGVIFLSLVLVWMIQLGAGIGGQLAVEGTAILAAALLQRGRSGAGKGGR